MTSISPVLTLFATSYYSDHFQHFNCVSPFAKELIRKWLSSVGVNTGSQFYEGLHVGRLWLLTLHQCRLQKLLNNGVARKLNKLRTSRGDYWNKQRFSSITSLFKIGTSLKGKILPPEGANSFLSEQFLLVWKIFFTRQGDLP